MKTGSILFIGRYFLTLQGTPYINDELIRRLRRDGWKIQTSSKHKSRVLFLFDLAWTILSRRKSYQLAEVDVFSGFAFSWAELSVKLLHFLQKPIILVLHGGNLPEFANRHPARVGKVLALASAVVAPSSYLQEKLSGVSPEICIIPNPIEMNRYTHQIRKAPMPKLIWLRSFHETYNPTLAPRVLRQLVDAWPSIQLTMLGPDKGDGSLNRTRTLAKSLHVNENINIIGQVPRQEVGKWLAGSDIFINTTNIDNTPVSVLEAMASGLCVISTCVGGIPYLLKDGFNALLVPPGDPVGMATAVNKVLTDHKLAREISENAMKEAEKYSWETVYPLWINLLLKIKGEKGN